MKTSREIISEFLTMTFEDGVKEVDKLIEDREFLGPPPNNTEVKTLIGDALVIPHIKRDGAVRQYIYIMTDSGIEMFSEIRDLLNL